MNGPKAFGATRELQAVRERKRLGSFGNPTIGTSLSLALLGLALAIHGSGAVFPIAAPSGLIGWWPGDGSTEDVITKNQGAPTNVEYASGVIGQAFKFVGSDSYIRVPSTEALRSLTNITLECWIWNVPTKPFKRVLTVTPDHLILGIDSNERPFLTIQFASHKATVVAPESMAADRWHHLAGTYDGQSVQLWIDGKSVASENAPGQLDNRGAGTEVYINFIQSGEVDGSIDEVAVYSRALTEREIRQHFSAGSAALVKVPIFTEIGVTFPGVANLVLRGRPGKPVTFQSSTNLFDWISVATNANELGTVSWSDATAGAFRRKFYRAVSEE